MSDDRPPAGAEWQRTFRVAATFELVTGSGRLVVTPGAIRLEPSWITARLSGVKTLAHTAPEVTLVHARWRAPWCNTALLLSDGDVRVRAQPLSTAVGRLREALTAAGFQIADVESRGSFDDRGVARRRRAR